MVLADDEEDVDGASALLEEEEEIQEGLSAGKKWKGNKGWGKMKKFKGSKWKRHGGHRHHNRHRRHHHHHHVHHRHGHHYHGGCTGRGRSTHQVGKPCCHGFYA